MTDCSDAVRSINSMLIQRLSIQMSPIHQISLLSRAQRSQVISSSLYDFSGMNHEGWSPQMTADPLPDQPLPLFGGQVPIHCLACSHNLADIRGHIAQPTLFSPKLPVTAWQPLFAHLSLVLHPVALLIYVITYLLSL